MTPKEMEEEIKYLKETQNTVFDTFTKEFGGSIRHIESTFFDNTGDGTYFTRTEKKLQSIEEKISGYEKVLGMLTFLSSKGWGFFAGMFFAMITIGYFVVKGFMMLFAVNLK